jgi:hypothetical protein
MKTPFEDNKKRSPRPERAKKVCQSDGRYRKNAYICSRNMVTLTHVA